MFGFHDFKWHQKLTVVVDTPSGPVTGSAVTEATVGLRPKWYGVGDSAGAGTDSLKGEAVVVEVAPGRYLFVLLKEYSAWTAGEAFFQPSKKLMNREQNVRAYGVLETLRESSPLPRDLYPLFVTFDDIADPASVKKVEPEDLRSSFGPGYKLQSVTIAITDELVITNKLEGILKWLCSYKQQRLRLSGKTGPVFDNQLANNLSSGEFSYVECK